MIVHFADWLDLVPLEGCLALAAVPAVALRCLWHRRGRRVHFGKGDRVPRPATERLLAVVRCDGGVEVLLDVTAALAVVSDPVFGAAQVGSNHRPCAGALWVELALPGDLVLSDP